MNEEEQQQKKLTPVDILKQVAEIDPEKVVVIFVSGDTIKTSSNLSNIPEVLYLMELSKRSVLGS